MSNEIKWSVAEIWNAVAYKKVIPPKKRDYIYASELGYPFYDRYLKMNGVPYTNPPNNRSLRKFLAGNIWEYVTKQILVAVGVFHKEEVTINESPYKGALEVHGRCDFVAGGFIDPNIAIQNVSNLHLPEFLVEVADKMIESISGSTLERKILELKSVSTFAMDKVEKTRAAIPNHSMQAYHYHKNGKIPAEILYICKDDCRMAQFPLAVDSVEALYRHDIEMMSKYYKKSKVPPLAPRCVFDDALAKFSKNLNVEYSPYLEHYGYKNPDEYRRDVAFIDKWNRTIARFALAEAGAKTPTGKPIVITSKNNEVKEEIVKAGYDFKSIIKLKIEMGDISEEEVDS